LFLLTVLLGSCLLFLTQPMVARMALPRFGGAPAVWNSAMLVFQALLLGGYAYAHWIGRLGGRRQAIVHLVLFAVAAIWLPIGIGSGVLPSNAEPVLWVPWFFVASIGPLFFMVSTQAPLMQRWYALESRRGDPYPLYAVSNLGSFAGLLSYPLLVEPLLTLQQQSILWSSGYALLVLLVATCALTIPAEAHEVVPPAHTPKPSARSIAHWIALAAVPSGLMLSTTTHLTMDIVAVPLLWVLPLGLYLLSFVIAFASRRGVAIFLTQLCPLIILISGGLTFAAGVQNPIYAATLGLSLLLVVAVTLHGEMYRLRPAADHLTAFYLAMAAGGVLGGLFAAIVAPVVFDWTYEHPLLILGAALLLPQVPLLRPLERLWQAHGGWLVVVVSALALLLSAAIDDPLNLLSGIAAQAATIVIILLALASIGSRIAFAGCVAALMMSYGGWWTLNISLNWDTRIRSYFGIYSITNNASGTARVLTHGTTLHGMQNLDAAHRLDPITYYGPRSGVGLAMRSAETLFGPKARIGVVGLGTGTLACYALPGQDWRFFEIDPAMVEIATHSGHFTYVPRCAPQAHFVLGDARISLSRAPAGGLDLLALDAFSSDAVPMHLLTREAFAVYARALQPGGLLVVHISNRYIELEPVVAAAAAANGWKGAVLDYYPTSEEEGRHETVSIWIALSRDPRMLDNLVSASGPDNQWVALRTRPGFSGWTDDYASVLPLLKPPRFDLLKLVP
jgi:SAM-dependent methyltransferase